MTIESLLEVAKDRFWLRTFIFLICIPSGGAVLAEVFGVARLHDVFWYLAIPGYVVLTLIWFLNRNGKNAEISDSIAIGAVSGFIGVIAYDVARIPFVMFGYRIFAQNSSYGLWILDADTSTRFSEVAGWIYHFANGTLFGVMYSIFMRNRHWGWAIAWAFLLETIALTSPYGHIYQITQSLLLTSVAYYGHVAYGLPIGFMTRGFDRTTQTLRDLSLFYRIVGLVLLASAVIGPLFNPASISADRAAVKGQFQVVGDHMTPAWQHLRSTGSVTVRNSCDAPRTILLDAKPALNLAPCATGVLALTKPGVRLLAIPRGNQRTRSSFVLVDPVSETP